MRVLVTLVEGGVSRDVVLDAVDDARGRDLAEALRTGARQVPDLFVGDQRLEADQPLRLGPVRHGTLLGVGSPAAVAPPRRAWEVRVESGPGAGTVCRLDPGEYVLGADPDADVTLAGAPGALTLVVRRDGVTVRWGPGAPVEPEAGAGGPSYAAVHPVLVDDGVHPGAPVTSTAPAPAVHLDRRPLTELTPWSPGRLLVLGPLLLALVPGTPERADRERDPAGATVRHHPAPRLLPPPRPDRFTLPGRPQEPERQPWPWLMALAPLGLGVLLFLLTHAWQSLLFLALSPVLALGGVAGGRRAARRRHARDVLAHATESDRVRRAALGAVRLDAADRRHRSPGPADLLDLARGAGPRLWERRLADPDALLLRIGTAEVASPVRLGDPDRALDQGDRTWLVPDLPVTLDLAAAGVLGVCGARRERVAEWLVAQVACLHGPDEVRVAVLDDGTGRHDWVCWLPHADGGDLPGGLVGADDLLRLLAQRRTAPGGAGAVVVLLDGRPPDALGELLEHGPAAGIRLICLAGRERDLPRTCRAVVRDEGGLLRLRRHQRDDVVGVRPDLVEPAWVGVLARALAPVRDAAPVGSEPPERCALRELVERGAPRGAGAAAVIGVGAGGRPVEVDLARDGPHALVAGTTGSGKSELLQTLVASLALAHPPEELGFVLVDYKGGAAFRTCADLPHVLGTVTDLDAHLTARALASLSAEVRRREAVLAAAGATDLDDLRRGSAPTLPRLVIVVDEFATLAADLPDFVPGLVDIARRGRSLGIHLVLATQRPAGAVTADIRANTSLRIALRVTDPGDSTDVVDVPDAARISDALPGRGLLRRGPEPPEAFQTARVTVPRRSGGVRVAVGAFPPGPPIGDRVDDPTATTDLDEVVATLRAAAGPVRMDPPWLPPLPDRVRLDDLDEAGEPGGLPGSGWALPYALLDEPEQQRRSTAVLDLAAGRHLAVIGAPGSGRTQLLRTLAAAVARRAGPTEVHLHAVDCGGGGLLGLAALPHTGVVVTRDQVHRMQRLVDRLARLVRERQDLLASSSYADVTAQRAARPGAALPWVLVLLDRWDSLCRVYDDVDGGRLVQTWQHLLGEAGAVGVTVVVTGDRSLGVGRMSTLFEDVVLLRTTDPGDLALVGSRARAVGRRPPGRGHRSPRGTECQVALAELPSAETDEPEGPSGARAFRLDDLPRTVRREQALVLPGDPAGLLLAVGGDRLSTRSVSPTAHGPGFLVAGPRRSGRSTALLALGVAALETGGRVLALAPRSGPLAGQRGIEVVAPDALPAALAALAPPGSLVLVDDLDLLDPDSPAAAALVAHLARIRDAPALLAAAGSPAELAALYRGPVVPLRRGGSGLLLAPRAPGEADLLGVRLARSALTTGPATTLPGRGHLVRDGEAEPVQVVLTRAAWTDRTDRVSRR